MRFHALIAALLFVLPLAAAQDEGGESTSADSEDPEQTGTTESNQTADPPSSNAPESQNHTQEGSDEGGTASDGQDAQGDDGQQGDGEYESEVQDDEDGFRIIPAAGSTRPALDFNSTQATSVVARDGLPTLTALVEGVTEYRDENGNGQYDLGETVLQHVALRDVDPKVLIQGNATRLVVYAMPSGGNVTLRFHLDPGDPQAASKFDVQIDDWPFHEPTSRIALLLHVQVNGGIRFTEVAGNPALAGTTGTDVPYLSWTPTVQVDGTTLQVHATIQATVGPGAGEATLAWSYPQGRHILHDPVLGVTHIPIPRLGDAGTYVSALLIGLVALFAGFAVRRRMHA